MNNLNSLLPKTQEVLVMLSELKLMESFTFVGGSALAVYLNHRLSEDLDFFSSEAELDTKAILDAINCLKPTDFRIINNSKTQLDLFINNVKVTFFANNWKELNNKTKLINHISIAPIHLLCAMKINTLFLRAKYRDYYDLYVINKDVYSLKEMFDFGKELIPGLTLKLFQNALVFVKDVDDESIKHLKPKYKLSLNKIASHFEQTIRLWLNSGK
jgi:predicted nucleotidyltransferase component of viral defense system